MPTINIHGCEITFINERWAKLVRFTERDDDGTLSVDGFEKDFYSEVDEIHTAPHKAIVFAKHLPRIILHPAPAHPLALPPSGDGNTAGPAGDHSRE